MCRRLSGMEAHLPDVSALAGQPVRALSKLLVTQRLLTVQKKKQQVAPPILFVAF